MKYIFKIILIFLLLTFPIFSYSESNIAYINMDVLINKSKVGQSITKALEVKQNQNMKEFKKIEEDLKKQENEIISKKNILNEEDYQKKVIELRKNAEDYRSKRKAKLDSFNKKKITATNEILKKIRPILIKYSNDNSLSIILEQKNIIIGKKELDITNKILEIVDKTITKIDLN